MPEKRFHISVKQPRPKTICIFEVISLIEIDFSIEIHRILVIFDISDPISASQAAGELARRAAAALSHSGHLGPYKQLGTSTCQSASPDNEGVVARYSGPVTNVAFIPVGGSSTPQQSTGQKPAAAQVAGAPAP
jgi:hypothetical protein